MNLCRFLTLLIFSQFLSSMLRFRNVGGKWVNVISCCHFSNGCWIKNSNVTDHPRLLGSLREEAQGKLFYSMHI